MHLVDGAHFDWSGVDTVLLDMDGTLLDLRFDNLFWREVVPARYGELHGLEPAEAWRQLAPRFAAREGTLEWYCLDHWSDALQLDVAELHRQQNDRIGFLPGAKEFLDSGVAGIHIQAELAGDRSAVRFEYGIGTSAAS